MAQRIEKHRLRLAKEREREAETARLRAELEAKAEAARRERDVERVAEAIAKDGVFDARWSSFDSAPQPRRPRFWPDGLWPW